MEKGGLVIEETLCCNINDGVNEEIFAPADSLIVIYKPFTLRLIFHQLYIIHSRQTLFHTHFHVRCF